MLSGNRKEQELLNDAELLAEHETAESWHCLRGALGFWCLDFGMSDLGVRVFLRALYNPLLRSLDYSSCISPPVSMFELLGLSCRGAGCIPEGEPS